MTGSLNGLTPRRSRQTQTGVPIRVQGYSATGFFRAMDRPWARNKCFRDSGQGYYFIRQWK
jgi:hypothetical protein